MITLKINEYLKQIRLDKNLSQSDLVDGIMDRSTYSRFENGITSNLSFESLLKILDRLSYSYGDFFSRVHSDYTYQEFKQLTVLLSDLYKQQDLSKLLDVRQEELDLYQESLNHRHLFNSFMADSLILDLDSTHSINEHHQEFFSEYLLDIETWTNYEMNLFGNSTNFFTNKQLTSLTRHLLNQLNKSSDPYPRNVSLVLLNLTFSFIKLHDFSLSSDIISTIESSKFEGNAVDIYQSILTPFYKAMINYHVGDRQEAKEQLIKQLRVIDDLGLNDLSERYRTGLTQLGYEI